MLVVDRHLDLVYANLAAQRLLHPTKLLLGRQLPEPWPEAVSLADVAERVFETAIASRREIRLDDRRTVALGGLAARSGESVALIVEDVSLHALRARTEREFITNAAHELLTPLTGIASAAHALQSGAKEIPEDRDRFLEHIAVECDRMSRLARSLLVIARARSGDEPPRLDLIELRPFLETLRRVAEAEGASSGIRISCAQGVIALGDPDVVEEALMNLLLNAMRHSPGAPIEISVAESHRTISIEIADHGPGILPEHLPRTSDRFFSAAGREGGFGLGLAIAEQALEALGGGLTITSRPGEGTRARADLRAASPAPA